MAGDLMDAVERHFAVPFEWGGSDCCLAACNVLVDMGFTDPATAYRGRYRSQEGAEMVMGGSVEDVAAGECERLGWPEISPSTPEPCDVGVVANTLAIWTGAFWAVKSEQGLAIKTRVRRAWRPKC